MWLIIGNQKVCYMWLGTKKCVLHVVGNCEPTCGYMWLRFGNQKVCVTCGGALGWCTVSSCGAASRRLAHPLLAHWTAGAAPVLSAGWKTRKPHSLDQLRPIQANLEKKAKSRKRTHFCSTAGDEAAALHEKGNRWVSWFWKVSKDTHRRGGGGYCPCLFLASISKRRHCDLEK